MKRTNRLILFVVCALLAFAIAGCGSKDLNDPKLDNAEFVKAAAEKITLREDTVDLFYADEEAFWYDFTTKPVFQPYFAMKKFKAEADAENPELVHYSCRVPGAVAVSYNMAYDTCFSKITKYSEWVELEGDVRVVSDADGKRRIDVSDGKNAFAVYASLRYVNPLFFSLNKVDVSNGLNNDNRTEGLNILLNRACSVYAGAVDKSAEDYAEEVVSPELEEVQEHSLKVMLNKNERGYGFANWYHSIGTGTKVVIAVILGIVPAIYLCVLVSGWIGKLKNGLRKRGYGRKKSFLTSRKKMPALLNDITYQTVGRGRDAAEPEIYENQGIYFLRGDLSQSSLLRGGGGLVYYAFAGFSRAFLEDKTMYSTLNEVQNAEYCAILMAERPKEQEPTPSVMRFLCKVIHQGLNADSYRSESVFVSVEELRDHIVTAAGWAAAALGRILAGTFTPDMIKENREHLSSAIDEYNSTVGDLQLLQGLVRDMEEKSRKLSEEERIVLASVVKSDTLRTRLIHGTPDSSVLIQHMTDIQEYIAKGQKKLSRGLGNFMIDHEDLPFAYLIHVMGNSQVRVPRFIRQGVIMGLIDWLDANKSHPEAKKLLDSVVAVRAEMIRTDDQLSFFEVRVPESITEKDYAMVLSDVLHCANPSRQYCDTEKLLSIASREVPGCMSMLTQYPLRLIDPANRQTMGFYRFRPYAHAIFVQFIPPENTGKVIARYHEVEDRTKPLSSGLNLQLFQDPYAVIPTIFHEYQHYEEDPNEASVFLKTQMFSTRFYKQYKQAKPAADYVFVHLTSLLGAPPDSDHLSEFNKLIESMYGTQLSEKRAKELANAEIAGINAAVDGFNSGLKWDPEVKLAHLSPKEDKEHEEMIREIVVRFATVPKSVTEEEFLAIVNGA